MAQPTSTPRRSRVARSHTPPMRPPAACPAFHRAFGLSLVSTWPIPGLAAESLCPSPDIQVALGRDHEWPAFDAMPSQLRYVSAEGHDAAALHVWTLEDGAYFRM